MRLKKELCHCVLEATRELLCAAYDRNKHQQQVDSVTDTRTPVRVYDARAYKINLPVIMDVITRGVCNNINKKKTLRVRTSLMVSRGEENITSPERENRTI